MKKVLGLDLGTTSIGWAFIENNGADSKLNCGVRIVPLTAEERDAFNQGQAISTNANRTQKRTARKTLDRYQMRRGKLLKQFKHMGWIGEDFQREIPETDRIWELRAMAISQPLEREDLVRVLLHMNKKRGFLSNRKSSNEENESDFKERIKESDRAVLELGYTIGQWVWEQIHERTSMHRVYTNLTFSRSLHRAEFDAIWEVQSNYHPELTEALKLETGDRTIFYQRRLKSQKAKLGHCTFNPLKKVIATSHPLFEYFRAWHDVNNLVVKFAHNRAELILDLEAKKTLVQALQAKEKLSSSEMLVILKRELGGKKTDYLVNFEKLHGCSTIVAIQKALDDLGLNRPELTAFNPYLAGDEFDKQPLLQLWHMLYSIEDEDDLVEALMNHFKLTAEQANRFAKIGFRQAYGSLCAATIKKILPYLEEGETYDQACALAGFRHSDYENLEEKKTRVLADQMAQLQPGELRNPVVEKIMNQLVNVVNAILEHPEMGRPDEIHLEMGRELTANAKQRNRMHRSNQDAKKEHDRIRNLLTQEMGLRKVSRNDIIKYKLGEECEWISLYSGKPIAKEKVFVTGEFDIEHIIPKSRLFDDSFSNLTLCEAEINRAKGNMTALDFMASQGTGALESYLDRVKRLSQLGGNKKLSRSKEAKLLMALNQIPEDFISRQLNETRYIAREALGRLRAVCRDIIPTSGILTAHLRKEWGLEDLIQDLNLTKYEALGQVVEIEDKNGRRFKKIEDWSKRDDHRHHAIDAIAVALTTRSMVQRANQLNKLAGGYDEQKQSDLFARQVGSRRFEAPLPHLRVLAHDALERVLVSYKAGKKVTTWSRNTIKVGHGKTKVQKIKIPRGQLHQETVYGRIRMRASENTPLKNIEHPHLIIRNEDWQAYEAHLKLHGGDPKLAFAAKVLSKHPFMVDGQIKTHLACWEEQTVVRERISEKLDLEKVIDPVIQNLLRKRLEECGGDAKKAFGNTVDNPLWFNQAKGIAIHKVRVKARPNILEALHTDSKTGLPVDLVTPGNNHHIAVYQKPSGELTSHLVTFMEAVQRSLEGLPVVDIHPANGDRFIADFSVNKYFLFADTIPEDPKALSDALFRVQKISSLGVGKIYIDFRHHLETDIKRENSFALKRIQSLKNLPHFSVRLSPIGEVLSIQQLHYA